MATKVTLRKKGISGNRESLYLDFYPPIESPETGKQTRREFLGMFLYLPIDNKKVRGQSVPVYDRNLIINKQYEDHNTSTLELAESIRQKRSERLNANNALSVLERMAIDEAKATKKQGEQSFIEYYKKLVDKRKASNYDNWISSYKHLFQFTDGKLSFSDLNVVFCNNYKDYLLNVKKTNSSTLLLSQNSASSYFNKFKAALKQAYKDELLKTNLNDKVATIKPLETHRNFLTIDELNALIKTDCQNEPIKKAAIFSALTGLRFSDILKMVWSEIGYLENHGYYIQFRQKKTSGAEVLPIPLQAVEWLGERRAANDKVIGRLVYSAYINNQLHNWIAAAGITKSITFHCFRHTYATLQLSSGTDIATVSKMLGHREMKTTQIYAKVIDKTKRAATDKINLKF